MKYNKDLDIHAPEVDWKVVWTLAMEAGDDV